MSLLTLTALTSLASCGGSGGTPSTSTTSAAGTSAVTSAEESTSAEQTSGEVETSSAAETSSPAESSSKPATRLELELKTSVIPHGATTYDGAQPIVTWIDKGEAQDASRWTQKIKYKVTNVDTEEVYTESDVLPVGKYIVEAKYNSKNKKDTAELEVVEGSPVVAEEGKGFHQMSIDELSQFQVNKWANMGALGDGKFPAKDIDGKHPKMIVVPVQFEDATFDDFHSYDESLQGEDFVRAVLDEAFFSKEGESPWLSLSAYYEKSSNGHLHIEGETSPVITYPKTAVQFDADVTAGKDSVSSIVIYCMNQLVSKYGYNRTDFDLNKDGYIDGINLIYATNQPTPSHSGNNDDASTWWNFTSVASGGNANVSNPATHRYFWSRYDYVMQNYYANVVDEHGVEVGLRDQDHNAVDTHTIIHENGHLMGLNDYYSYDHNEGPAGCVDMMDCNVGDHNAYSKMIWNWVAPKVIDGTSDNFYIDLPSFEKTGDFLLLRKTDLVDGHNVSTWSGNPYDEYLVIQYYTPTGVNAMDSDGYGEWTSATSATGGSPYGHGGTYADPGLQVFHVDNRGASIFYNKTKSDGTQMYTTNMVATDTKISDNVTQSATFSPHSNTPSRSYYGQAEDGHRAGEYNAPYRELSAVFASGANSLNSSSYTNVMGNTKNLFGDPTFANKEGETNIFGGNVFTRYKMKDFFPNVLEFDDGSSLNWTFSVESQTADSIRLHFVENK